MTSRLGGRAGTAAVAGCVLLGAASFASDISIKTIVGPAHLMGQGGRFGEFNFRILTQAG